MSHKLGRIFQSIQDYLTDQFYSFNPNDVSGDRGRSAS